MPTQVYLDDKGKRLPGVTTVIGGNLGWNKDALMGWANREGLEGRNIRDRFNTASKAADIGTLAHEMIEADIHHRDPEGVVAATLAGMDGFTEAMADKARKAYLGFRRWRQQSNVHVIGTELWGVDLTWRTGYCIDALIEQPGLDTDELVLTIGDWKSSKGTYSDHLIQVAAYAMLVESALKEGRAFSGGDVKDEAALARWLGREDLRIDGAHVVRVSKTTGGFSHKWWDRDLLDEGWKVFQWLRSLHERKWTFEDYVK